MRPLWPAARASASVSAALASFRSAKVTLAPSLRKRRTAALPMPLAPPVMTAARPSNLLPNLPAMFRSAIGNFASPSLKDAAGQGLPLPNRRFRPTLQPTPNAAARFAMPEPYPLRFFNTRTRKIEPFAPIAPPKVTLYCCGPTVYNYAHIGNLRTYVFEDLLQRTIRLAGYDLRHVMNITDVGHLESDADQGRRQDDAGGGARAQIALGHRPLLRGRILPSHRHDEDPPARHICRATGHIPQMIAMIERLVARGHAYAVAGNVYFDTATFPAYPDFARLQMDAQEATERIDADERKRNPADFVLWFGQSKYS